MLFNEEIQLIYNINVLQCNRLLRWCPSADCNYAVKVQYVDARAVECKCGHIFCFECSKQWHDQVLRKWIKKCDDDLETSNWIAANTKEGPKCPNFSRKLLIFCAIAIIHLCYLRFCLSST